MSFEVPITRDDLFEPSETFRLTIDTSSLPSRVVIRSMCRLDVTIVDNDCELALSILPDVYPNNGHILYLIIWFINTIQQ